MPLNVKKLLHLSYFTTKTFQDERNEYKVRDHATRKGKVARLYRPGDFVVEQLDSLPRAYRWDSEGEERENQERIARQLASLPHKYGWHSIGDEHRQASRERRRARSTHHHRSSSARPETRGRPYRYYEDDSSAGQPVTGQAAIDEIRRSRSQRKYEATHDAQARNREIEARRAEEERKWARYAPRPSNAKEWRDRHAPAGYERDRHGGSSYHHHDDRQGREERGSRKEHGERSERSHRHRHKH
ncbi:hypothetical protein F5X98DRAFT_371066 [Xylaria grammica]|nr:hypothetical protein F5X98DRAFT_371066 [Xylaria grammica]